MPDKKITKRKAPISYRPPKDRWAAFDARVRESGLSVNAFITESIFGRTRHRPAEIQLLASLLFRCAQVSDRLREFERSHADCGAGSALEATRAELAEIRAALFVLMGRMP